jgi:hypothetical protein
MNDQELINEVRKLKAGTSSKQGIPYDQLSQRSFLDNDGFKDLLDAWNNSSYSKKETWKWRQFVTMALEDPGKRAYMYRRTVSLLSDFGDSHKKYFILQTENGLYHIPNFESRLNRLKLLYRDYFKIYQNILTRIHFDYPKEEQIGRIKGNINWTKTIQLSSTNFPLKFVTSISKKNFVTPENILLILCAYWMLKESKKLLQFNFDEELSKSSKKILFDISKKSESILHTFPFNQVLEESKQFWNLLYDPPNVQIKQLELKTKERIEKGKIRNTNYAKLLKWIEKFRDLSIKTIDNKSSTRNILQSLENTDTIYEVWIFMEFVSYLKQRGVLRNFELGRYPKCEFIGNGNVVTFWFNKTFTLNQSPKFIWAKSHKPDFIAMMGNAVLGIFDAKNYGRSTELGDTQNVILAYMNNFNTSFGALFYPEAPVNWDDPHYDYTRKENELIKIVNEKNPDSSTGQKRGIRNKINSLLDCNWNELDAESKKILKNDHNGELTETTKDILNNILKLVPRGFEEIKQPDNVIGNNDFHTNQTLAYLRMSPEEDAFSIYNKNQTLAYLYDTIVKAIPLTVNQN